MDNPVNKYNHSSLPLVGLPNGPKDWSVFNGIERMRKCHRKKSEISFSNINLTVKLSKNVAGEYGVFADEEIPENTIIEYSKSYREKINDLAFNPTEKYNLEDIKKYTNCMFVMDELDNIIGVLIIKNIKKGEELSRAYGDNYWNSFIFWNKFKDNKYLLTKNDDDLPSDWICIDTISSHLYSNLTFNLYGKKENDKYHYIYDSIYHGLIDVSRENFRKMEIYECIDTDENNAGLLISQDIFDKKNINNTTNLYRVEFLLMHDVKDNTVNKFFTII